MTLKVNAGYRTETGFIIPRSHFKKEKGEKFAVVEILTDCKTHFTREHTTFTVKEFRDALNLAQKERIEIV